MAQYGAMMQQPWMNGARVVGDVKPRLTKEQHDILESHFRQQHKPSTQTKKGFAENLGVPLDKINNWFQNRRAKVKQDAKKAINAQNMFIHQQLAHQMQNGGAPLQHADFFPGQPHLSPSAFPLEAPSSSYVMPPGVVDQMPLGPPPTGFDMGAIAAKPNFVAYPPGQDLAYDQFCMTHVQDFGAIYGDMSGSMEGMDLPFLPGTAMQVTQSNGSTPSIPSTLSSMPSQSTMPSSVGALNAAAMVPNEWNDDTKPTICFSSEASDGTVGPQSAYCSPPEDSNTARWVSQQPPVFDGASSPEPEERPGSSQDLPPTPPDNQPSTELELPNAAFSRRPSSTGLSEPLGDVDIHAQPVDSDGGFKQPGEPSSLAARRQRPRPAALGQASLRSVSYSAGMPVSPGSNPNSLIAPEQQLRRIRSSGVPGAPLGRVQKTSVAGQRSPLHMSFADAADSPKFARHAATWAAPTHSPGAQSLAPPTPLTPHDGSRFPSWQSFGSVNSHQNSLEHSSPNGIALSWTADSPALFEPRNISSPPDTPLDAAQVAQYNEWLRAAEARRNTPPQSAPAFQQSFYPAGFGLTAPANRQHLAVHEHHMGHARKSSLPEHSRSMAPQANVVQSAPGDVSLNYPGMPFGHMQVQQMPPQPPTTLLSQTPHAFPTPPQPAPASISVQNNVLAADFAVHEYLPPGAMSRVKSSSITGDTGDASGPKLFHFSNTGPRDFAS